MGPRWVVVTALVLALGSRTSSAGGASSRPLGIDVEAHWRIFNANTPKVVGQLTPSTAAGIGLAVHLDRIVSRLSAHSTIRLDVAGSLGASSGYATGYDTHATLGLYFMLLGKTGLYVRMGGGGNGVTESETFVMPGNPYGLWALGMTVDLVNFDGLWVAEFARFYRDVDGTSFERGFRVRNGIGFGGWTFNYQLEVIGEWADPDLRTHTLGLARRL